MITTIDPYKILKIRRMASIDEIEKAYRKQANKFHPDKGGDPDKFKELQQCYDLLINENRRARYDATGDFSEQKRDTTHQEVMSLIAHVYLESLKIILNQNSSTTKNDLLSIIIRILNQEVGKLNEQRNNLAKLIKEMNESLLRFDVKEGEENEMVSMIKNHLHAVEGESKMLDRPIEIHNKAIELFLPRGQE